MINGIVLAYASSPPPPVRVPYALADPLERMYFVNGPLLESELKYRK